MSAKDLISKEISPLTPDTTISDALELMEELKVNALPLVEEGTFRALLTEKELSESPDPSAPAASLQGSLLAVRTQAHLLEMLDRFAQSEADLLPVISDNNEYVGVITRKTLLNRLATICDTTSPGALIQIEMMPDDYVLSDIARLAEQNNARILNLFTYPDPVSGKLQVLLKVDQEDATYFLRSLERFNYRIVAHYHHDDITDELIRQRLEELIYYIEM